MNFNLYIDQDSFLHRVNPAIKYVLLIVFLFSLAFSNFEEDLLFIVLIQGLIFLGRLPYFYIQRKMLFIIPLTLFIALGTLLYPAFTVEIAINIGLRFYIIVSLVLIMNMTTPIISLLGLFSGIVKRFTSEDNAANITMIFLLVINFIPLIFSEMSKVNQSLNSRRISIKNKNISKNMFYLTTFCRALVNRIDVLIDEYELVFYARNISVHNINNINQKYQYHFRDFIFSGICIVLVLIIKLYF